MPVRQVEGQGEGGGQLAVLGKMAFEAREQIATPQARLKARAPVGEGFKGIRGEAQEGRCVGGVLLGTAGQGVEHVPFIERRKRLHLGRAVRRQVDIPPWPACDPPAIATTPAHELPRLSPSLSPFPAD